MTYEEFLAEPILLFLGIALVLGVAVWLGYRFIKFWNENSGD